MSGAPAGDALLGDLRVVEVAGGVAAPFAARILADSGAQVTKVEPPSGDPTRGWGPFPDGRADPDASATFFAFNHGKQGVVLDLGTPDGLAALDGLLADAHLLVEDGRLPVEDIAARHPHLVVVSVTPFGRSGPDAGRPATEIVAYAAAGAMSSTGLPDREPLHLGGHLVQAQAGNVAALAALAAVVGTEATGTGQLVDVSWMEAEAGSFDRCASNLLAYSYEGTCSRREDPLDAGLPMRIYPCADGEVVVNTIGSTIRAMLDVVGGPELDDLRAQPRLVFTDDGRARVDRALRAWAAGRTRTAATAEAQAAGWSVTPVNDLLAVLDDPYLREAGATEEVDAGALGRVRVPAGAFRTPGGPRHRGPAPRLGGTGP